MRERSTLMMNFTPGVQEYLDGLKKVIDEFNIDQVTLVMERLLAAYRRRASVYVFGNGGSASTASHFVNDFNKGISERLDQGFRFFCLNDNIPTMMAVANDISYDRVFALQLKNYLQPGDVVLAISGSGNSTNVIDAVRFANQRGVETIGLVGFDGGRLKELARFCIHVPVDDMQKAEDLHLVINHVMMVLFKEHLQAE